MAFYLNNSWLLFSIFFGLLLFFTFLMHLQSKEFYTKDVVIRKFTIFDLELASTPTELANIIKGLYQLPQPQSKKTVNALKKQLYIDFLFMPCAYGSVYLLCKMVAERMQLSIGYYFFIVLACGQLLSWICDIIENIYLLSKIHPHLNPPPISLHKTYLKMEAIKWGLVLIGAVCSVSAICYFWLSGHYSSRSLPFILIVLVEVIMFLIFQMLFIKKSNFDKNA